MIVRVLNSADVALVCQAAAGVFDHASTESLSAEFLKDPRHHLVAAIEEQQVIGFVSAVHYVHPDKPAELWINEVALAPAWQGRGVGRQMLKTMLAHGRELGCVNAWVLTDKANISAMRLYAAAGGVEAPVPSVMFEFNLDPSPET